MKKAMKPVSMILALVLILAMGVTALAEDTVTESAQVTESTETTTALQDALTAYAAAKKSSKATDLEAELKSYVEAGTMTQEQADLILNAYKEQEALRNGVCPNCGYVFSGSTGKGMRTNTQKTGKQGAVITKPGTSKTQPTTDAQSDGTTTQTKNGKNARKGK